MIRKALILLQIFVSSIALSDELVRPDGVIDNIVVTMHTFQTYGEMREALAVVYPKQDWSDIEGASDCFRNVEQNIAYCDVYIVEPREVDGEHTLTLGHEVLHGRYGPRYHEW